MNLKLTQEELINNDIRMEQVERDLEMFNKHCAELTNATINSTLVLVRTLFNLVTCEQKPVFNQLANSVAQIFGKDPCEVVGEIDPNYGESTKTQSNNV
jgi:hypothetical protein